MKNSPLYIIWRDQNNTGFSILDEQHRGIVATINSLHYFIQQGLGLDALQPTLKVMQEYIGFHLKTEEMILSYNQYPKIKEVELSDTKTFSDFKRISKEACLHKEPELLLRFLRNWWLNHIQEKHPHYCKFIKS